MPLLSLGSKPFFDDKNRAFWVLQSLGWGGYLVLRSLSGLANNMGWLFILPTALSTATGYSLTLLMAAAYRRLIDMRWLYTWVGSIVILVAAAFAFSTIEVWAHATFYRPGLKPEGVQFLGAVLLDFALLAAWSALYYAVNFFIQLEQKTHALARMETQASTAQLAMLRYQLNPHFLFNTLNSISTLVLLKQTDRANAMLSRLSSFLRYTIANEPTAEVTLVQEVETLKLYLEIEKMRFEDRLRAHFDIDPRTMQARLPSLLLQPLVENAIKYAVTPQEEGADISVVARLAGNRVQITVSDTGPGLKGGAIQPSYGASQASTAVPATGVQSTGVGLANIRDRLAQAYGPDHRFEVQGRAGGGFGVMIEIPMTEASRDTA
jgi:sensor histidine kinase YesM